MFGLTEIWYRSHESQFIERVHWQARWPQQNDSFQLLPVAETTRVILHCDVSGSAIWEDPRGVRWWGFFARWKPGRAALQLVRSHSPEICLPAVGRTFVGESPPLTVQTGSISLLFRVYEFKQAGEPLFVFVSIQDDKRTVSSLPVGDVEWNLQGRIMAAWHGQRNLGQRLLEIAVTGPADYARAIEAATKTISEVVEIEQPTG